MEETKTALDVQARIYPAKDGGNLLAFASVGKPSLRGALQSAAKELAERPFQAEAEQENGEPEA